MPHCVIKHDKLLMQLFTGYWINYSVYPDVFTIKRIYSQLILYPRATSSTAVLSKLFIAIYS